MISHARRPADRRCHAPHAVRLPTPPESAHAAPLPVAPYKRRGRPEARGRKKKEKKNTKKSEQTTITFFLQTTSISLFLSAVGPHPPPHHHSSFHHHINLRQPSKHHTRWSHHHLSLSSAIFLPCHRGSSNSNRSNHHDQQLLPFTKTSRTAALSSAAPTVTTVSFPSPLQDLCRSSSNRD